MDEHIIKTEHQPKPSYMLQNQIIDTTVRNVSVVPQISMRPNTLPINTPYGNDTLLFTPNDCNKFFLPIPEVNETLRAYTGPDFIDPFVTQPSNIEQPSPGGKILDDLLSTPVDNNNHSMISTTNAYEPITYKVVPNTGNQRQETFSTFPIQQTQSQITSRIRSISSSMNDNESSNSTTPSSPLSVHRNSNQGKDELQHVPSIRTKPRGEHDDVVRKEKKRERNRQAAQKCRTRKLTRIAELQKRVTELQGKNKDLSNIADCLKTDITRLEKQLHDHHSQGCTLMNGSLL